MQNWILAGIASVCSVALLGFLYVENRNRKEIEEKTQKLTPE